MVLKYDPTNGLLITKERESRLPLTDFRVRCKAAKGGLTAEADQQMQLSRTGLLPCNRPGGPGDSVPCQTFSLPALLQINFLVSLVMTFCFDTIAGLRYYLINRITDLDFLV